MALCASDNCGAVSAWRWRSPMIFASASWARSRRPCDWPRRSLASFIALSLTSGMLFPLAGGRPLVLSLAAVAGRPINVASNSVGSKWRERMVGSDRRGLESSRDWLIIDTWRVGCNPIFRHGLQLAVEELAKEGGGGDGVKLLLLSAAGELFTCFSTIGEGLLSRK